MKKPWHTLRKNKKQEEGNNGISILFLRENLINLYIL
jgi:hypothetical protein